MATFTGSSYADTITPDVVSALVAREPSTKPSSASDRIEGLGANDILDGGGGVDRISGGDGGDTITSTAAGGTVHGDAGNDQITITHETAWKTVAAEPDYFADGSDLTVQLPGARASVPGEPDTSVIAADGIIEDPGPGAPDGPHNFATTGTLVFGQDPANAPAGGWGQGMPLWNAEEFGLLRVDFDEPTNFVSIDFAFDDDDIASLKAFDAAGNLLDAVEGSGDGRGPSPTFTGSIARETADISYVTAGGLTREALYLDNLHYNLPADSIALSGAVYGDGGDDEITVDLAAVQAATVAGSISLYGGDGNDSISVSHTDGDIFSQPDALKNATFVFYGGAGEDALSSTFYAGERPSNGAANDVLYGGPGNDTYSTQEASDRVIEYAGEGNDAVLAYSHDYALPANVENLQLVSNPDFPGFGLVGHGNSSNNVITGTEEVDTLYGDLGNDAIYGQDGGDSIYGGRSADDPTDGPDRIYGDGGNDQVWAGGGDDIVYGGPGNEIHLSGQSGNDTLHGEAGTDYLGGGSGNDILYGGTENDILSGTDGLDRLSGQGGTDTFDYDAVSHSRVGSTLRDVITDFTGVGGSTRTEVIDLSTIDANTGVSGNQAFTFRGTSAFSAPGQIRVQTSGATDTLIQANVTGTSGAEMEILVTDGTALPTSWNALDFLL